MSTGQVGREWGGVFGTSGGQVVVVCASAWRAPGGCRRSHRLRQKISDPFSRSSQNVIFRPGLSCPYPHSETYRPLHGLAFSASLACIPISNSYMLCFGSSNRSSNRSLLRATPQRNMEKKTPRHRCTAGHTTKLIP